MSVHFSGRTVQRYAFFLTMQRSIENILPSKVDIFRLYFIKSGDIFEKTGVNPAFEVCRSLVARVQSGSADLQNAFSRVKLDSANLQNAFSRRKLGSADLQNAFSRRKSDFADLQNAIARVKLDSADLQNAIARVKLD